MAVYRHLKNDKKSAWVYEFLKNGKRHRKGGFRTKKEAKEAEAEARLIKEVKTDTDFVHLCESRLEEIELNRSRNHFARNRALFNKLIPIWGAKKEVTRDDVELYLKKVARENKKKANKELVLIKALFNHGVEREWIVNNPASRIKPYPVDKTSRYVPPKEDVEKVFRLAEPLDRLYLMVVLLTVARISEVNRLKWEDIKEDYLELKSRKAKTSSLTERKYPLSPALRKVFDRIPKVGRLRVP